MKGRLLKMKVSKYTKSILQRYLDTVIDNEYGIAGSRGLEMKKKQLSQEITETETLLVRERELQRRLKNLNDVNGTEQARHRAQSTQSEERMKELRLLQAIRIVESLQYAGKIKGTLAAKMIQRLHNEAEMANRVTPRTDITERRRLESRQNSIITVYESHLNNCTKDLDEINNIENEIKLEVGPLIELIQY